MSPEKAILERLATSAARFRAAAVAAVARLKPTAEPEFRRAGGDLDYDLAALARVRGKSEPWPAPAKPALGALVALERDGKRFVGFVEVLDEEGRLECVGVGTTAGLPVICRWHAYAAEVRVV